MESIGGKIRALRRAKNIRQKALAHRAGLSPATLANFEQGRRSISLDWLQKLAGALETPLASLLPEERGSRKSLSGDPRERRLIEAYRLLRNDDALGRELTRVVELLADARERLKGLRGK